MRYWHDTSRPRMAWRILSAVLPSLMLLLALGAGSVRAQGLEPGAPLPGGTLQGPEGTRPLAQLTGRAGTVVVFWSNQCPWTENYEDRLLDLRDRYGGQQGFAFVLINPNNPEAFPQESLEGNQEQGYPVPYLKDPGGAVARAFGAERTPHVFVFDANDRLVYAGAIDDSPGDPGNVGATYLGDALAALAESEAVSTAQTKAFGCTIKF